MIDCDTFLQIAKKMAEFADTTGSERMAAFMHYESCAECRTFIDTDAAANEAAGVRLSPEDEARIEDMAIRDSLTKDPEINLPPV